MNKLTLPATIGRPALNALHLHGIVYLDDIADLSEKELLALHGVGQKAIAILRDELKKHNIPSKLLSS